MDEYADIYYVDSARNATGNDHRTGSPGGSMVPGRLLPAPVGARTVYVQPTSQPYAYTQPVTYGQPMPQSPFSSLFGNVNTGGQVPKFV